MEVAKGRWGVQAQELVIFDCDGVLVDSELLSAKAHKLVYERYGVVLTDAVIASTVGMNQTDTINKIKAATGFELPAEAIPEIRQEDWRLIRQDLQPTSGIASVLQNLRSQCCVASSSSPERISLSLQITQLDRFFAADRVFSSSMVSNGKPAPDLFLLAAAKCGIPANRCTVIEDSIYGVQAAIAAKMRVVGYVGGSHSHDAHASLLQAAGATDVIASWTEIGSTGW